MSAARDVAQPVSAGERLELLDVLRGLALFGILIANIRSISGWRFLSAERQAALFTSEIDHVLDLLATALVTGKFYSIFSLLFGIGFAVLVLRIERRGAEFIPFIRRRLLLLAFGMVHIFVWEGDILVLYALVGFLLIPARRLSDRTLLIGAAALIVTPIAMHGLYVLSGGALQPGRPLQALVAPIDMLVGLDPDTTFDSIHGEGGWIALMKFHAVNPVQSLGSYLNDARPLKVLAMFLLGFVAAAGLRCRGLRGRSSAAGPRLRGGLRAALAAASLATTPARARSRGADGAQQLSGSDVYRCHAL